MTRRDRELLNKQMGRHNPKPRNNGGLILAILGVFLAGIALGGSMSGHENKPVSFSPKTSVVASSFVR